MNGTMIIYMLGWVMNLEAAFMLLPCLTALIYRESAGFSFLIVAFALLIAGVLCTFRKPANKAFYARGGLCRRGTELDPAQRDRRPPLCSSAGKSRISSTPCSKPCPASPPPARAS